MIKVAVIGTGSIGSRHLSILKEMPGVIPVPLPKRGSRTLKEAFEEGASHCIVASDTGLHVEDGLQALEFGMNLLVEKPVSIDVASALPLIAAAKAKSNKVFVGSVLRCSESLNLFREWLPKAGAFHSVHIACQSYLPEWRPQRDYRESYSARRGEGGILLDLIHEIDYAGWIFGWPSSVGARLRNLGRLGIESEEMAELWWETEKKTLVTVSLDYLSRVSERKISAQGEKGLLEWNGLEGSVTFCAPGRKAEAIRCAQTKEEMYREQLAAFVSKGRYPLATLADGLKALSICDTARISSEEGREIFLDAR